MPLGMSSEAWTASLDLPKVTVLRLAWEENRRMVRFIISTTDSHHSVTTVAYFGVGN